MSIATNKAYHNLAFSEKDSFLNFIYKLGEMGLKRIFKFPKEDFSLWWFSLIAEKPPLKTDSYEKLISFLLSQSTRQQRKTLKEQAKFLEERLQDIKQRISTLESQALKEE